MLQRHVYAHRLPDFAIVGAQKAGTRFLQQHLEGHPQIRFGKRLRFKYGALKFGNELHYFDRHYHRGTAWYRSHFAFSRWEQPPGGGWCFGEKSPAYLCHPQAPERVLETMPRAKFVVLLRDPVDRAYSQYRMRRRKGQEARSFAEVVEADLRAISAASPTSWARSVLSRDGVEWGSCLARGLYAPQLRNWLSLFPRSSLKVIFSETMFADPGPVFDEVLEFLDLSSWRPSAFVICSTCQILPSVMSSRQPGEPFISCWKP